MHLRPRLSREFVASPQWQGRRDVDMPPVSTLDLPERAVQFGTGAFLRGFIEYFLDAANRQGVFNGTVVAVSSTGSGRDGVLNEQEGLYTLAIRGLEDGVPVQRYRVIASLSRALSARDEWPDVLAVARDPNIEIVFSNTTEVGIALDEDDLAEPGPPRSFPGKLTSFLYERARTFDYDVARGLTVVPCELVEDNGTRLREIVHTLAVQWALGSRFESWLDRAVVFCNTLVDRIVTGTPALEDVKRLSDQLGYHDGLVTVCESYRLFAIEGDPSLRARLAFADPDEGVIITPGIVGYRDRKVRVLNGAHTIVVPTALLCGLETVREAVEDKRVGRFLKRVVFDEIVPSLSVPGGEEFAAAVLERFANPFIRHALIDITLQGTMKMRVRVVPSILGFYERTGQVPTGLAFGFAAYLVFLRGEFEAERRARGLAIPEDAQAAVVRVHWDDVDAASDASLGVFVERVCADQSLWGANLSAVPGFVEAVAMHLARVCRDGVEAALDAGQPKRAESRQRERVAAHPQDDR